MGGFSVCRGYFGWGKGGEHGFDLGRLKLGRVEEGEGDFRVSGAEHVANEDAELGDGFCEVGREGVAFAQEEKVLFGGGAEGGSCVGDVGGAAGGRAVWGVEADRAEGDGDGVKVAVEDFEQDRVQIREVAADGGGAEAHGRSEAGHCKAGSAMRGHERGGGGEDTILCLELARGDAWAGAWEVVGLSAEDADGDGHVAKIGI